MFLAKAVLFKIIVVSRMIDDALICHFYCLRAGAVASVGSGYSQRARSRFANNPSKSLFANPNFDWCAVPPFEAHDQCYASSA